MINLFNRSNNKINFIVKLFNAQNNENVIQTIVIETDLKNKQIDTRIRLNRIIIN